VFKTLKLCLRTASRGLTDCFVTQESYLLTAILSPSNLLDKMSDMKLGTIVKTLGDIQALAL